MDFEGNDYAVQPDRSEESVQGASDAIRKMRCKEAAEESAWRESNDSLDTACSRDLADLIQGQPRRGGHQKPSQQSENYAEMCEHQRGGGSHGNFSDRCTVNFNGGNVSENRDRGPRRHCHGLENNNMFDANRRNNLHGNCKSGINISVVSQREHLYEGEVAIEPKYNVSFKSGYDSVNEMWGTKGKQRMNLDCPAVSFSTKGDRKRRSKKKETTRNQEEGCEGPLNFRCTFENCCGNCESYIMEIPESDCRAYQNWQSMDLRSANACFDDCCCSRKVKVYSPNLSVESITYPQQSCVTCTESGRCCPAKEPKCEYFVTDCHASSKHYLQRVHFTKDPSTKTNHSSCSFCSRKCTPSKASLFVEVGESMADVCNLRQRRSGQAFRCASDSTESFGDDSRERGITAVRRNKSGLFRSRSKSKKCTASCKFQPGAVTRSYSDRIGCMESCVDDDATKLVICNAMGPCNQNLRNAISNVSFREGGECRAQTGSEMYVNKGTADCDQQYDTSGRSLWDDIRKRKIWSQLQDTYRNFLKVATTSINQLVKQSSKLKRSKKSGKCTPTCETSPLNCDKNNIWSDPYNPPDCLGDEMCRMEVTSDAKDSDADHCQNVCCSFNETPNVTGLPVSEKYNYCSHYRDAREPTPSNRGWHFDPHDGGVHGNVYPPSGGPLQDLQRPKYAEARKRGGSDGKAGTPSPKKKDRNWNRRRNPNTGEQWSPSSNRGHSSSKNHQKTRQPIIQEESNSRNQQIRPAESHEPDSKQTTMYIDMYVQTSTIHEDVEPGRSPIVTENVEYRKRIQAVKRLGPHLEPIADTPHSEMDTLPKERALPEREESWPGPTIQEVDASVQSLARKGETKTPTRQRKPSTGPRQTSATSTPMPKAGRRDALMTPQSLPRREIAPKGRPVTKTPGKVAKEKTSTSDKEVQCDILKTHQVICTKQEATEATSQVDESCACPPKEGTVVPADASTIVLLPSDTTAIGSSPVTSTIIEDADTTDAAPVEKLDATGETPVDDASTKETTDKDATKESDASAVQETVATPDAESKANGADESVVEGEETVPATEPEATSPLDTSPAESATLVATPKEADSTIESQALEKITALTPVNDKELEKLEQFGAPPIEYSREFEGGHNVVSMEMQTSSTILTKIVSEFQVGNKRKRILMSIKLQTTSDGPSGTNGTDGADEEHQDESNGAEAAIATRQTPTRDNLPRSNYSQRKRPSISKPKHPQVRKLKYNGNLSSSYVGGATDQIGETCSVEDDATESSNETALRSHARLKYEPCTGPCGKKRPRYLD